MIFFLLIWSLTSLGFLSLAASMSKHQKQLFQRELTSIQTKQAALLGWGLLAIALIISLCAGTISNMLSYWIGCLTFAALLVASCLSYYAQHVKKFALVCVLITFISAVLSLISR